MDEYLLSKQNTVSLGEEEIPAPKKPAEELKVLLFAATTLLQKL